MYRYTPVSNNANKQALTRSRSSFGVISSFATFPWNFFDKYDMTSLSQFWKKKLTLKQRDFKPVVLYDT